MLHSVEFRVQPTTSTHGNPVRILKRTEVRGVSIYLIVTLTRESRHLSYSIIYFPESTQGPHTLHESPKWTREMFLGTSKLHETLGSLPSYLKGPSRFVIRKFYPVLILKDSVVFPFPYIHIPILPTVPDWDTPTRLHLSLLWDSSP